MHTRQDYLKGLCTHREYYGQFVTPRMKAMVKGKFGDRLFESIDPRFNDIPLKQWDSLVHLHECLDRTLWIEANGYADKTKFYWSLADQVCLAKEAARQVVEDAGGKVPAMADKG